VYSVLGAERAASWNELRRSYRARARELHPDVQTHRPTPSRLEPARATALFTQLQAAWSLVATPERRAAYDLTLDRSPVLAGRPRRSAVAPRWSAGPVAGVLLRTGPGDLHIAIPGGGWNLSLAEFLGHAGSARIPPLLIGDLPPHLALRQALLAVDFVERLRLTTMVGLEEPAEYRGGAGADLDDDGAWKLEQLDRALQKWARAQPDRRAELPYAADLRLMGQLSLAGYEINLPHPAGLFQALEPRPGDRREARRRSAQPVLELRLPPLALAVAASWSGDQLAMAALERGWDGLTAVAGLASAELVAARRALEAKRARRDSHEALPGSALDGGQLPVGALPLLRALPSTLAWVAEVGRLPGSLPWGDPVSVSGEDQLLGDAAARLGARVLDRLLREPPPGLRLVAMSGSRLRFRAEADPTEAVAWLNQAVSDAFKVHLGFPSAPSVTEG